MTPNSHFSPYAPIRYRDHLMWQLAREAVQRGYVRQNGTIDAAFAQTISHRAGWVLDRYAELLGGRTASGYGPCAADTLRWAQFACTAALFEAERRQIFDFTERCLKEVQDTEVREATLEGLELPYDCFFLRFGRIESLKAPYREGDGPEGWEYVDGAFIARLEGTQGLQIGLTMIKESGEGMQRAPYLLTIPPEYYNRPCLEAVDAAYEHELELLREHPVSDPVNGAMYVALYEMYAESRDLLKKAMPTVLSALFWLENPQERLVLTPGRDTSSERVAHWANADEKRRGKLRSKLASEGYALVYVVDYDTPTSESTGDGEGVRPPTRRAHWRNQRHGPRLSQVKRIRIKKQFINSREASAEEIPGHIYVPGSERPQ